MKLLYVEDHRAIAQVVAKTLRLAGHEVTLLHSQAEALAVGQDHDVGIFDLGLPDGDGIELCERLLREGRIGAALFCSNSIDELLLERAARTAPVIGKDASQLGRALAAMRVKPSES